MTVTINGTTGIAGVDGSAATPAVQGADTNTGIFFPAADTIAFTEGGTEVMRLDSSGQVGIGTSSPTRLLTLSSSGVNTRVQINNTVSGKNFGLYAADDGNSTINYGTSSDLLFTESGTERMRLNSSGNLLFNSGYGSVATAYGCRAWVNFNGTGTVAIRGSGNVTSITDNGTGDYTVNFTTAMPDVNYSWSIAADRTTAPIAQITSGTATPATSNLRVMTYNTSLVIADSTYIAVNIFR